LKLVEIGLERREEKPGKPEKTLEVRKRTNQLSSQGEPGDRTQDLRAVYGMFYHRAILTPSCNRMNPTNKEILKVNCLNYKGVKSAQTPN